MLSAAYGKVISENMKKILDFVKSLPRRFQTSITLIILTRLVIFGIIVCGILPIIWGSVIPTEFKVNSSFLDLVCVVLLGYIFIARNTSLIADREIIIINDKDDEGL